MNSAGLDGSVPEHPLLRRLFALIPAAGMSRRMGAPKLLLEIGRETLIRRLVRALSRPEIESISVLVRAKDSALRRELASTPVNPVVAESDPPDMLDSVRRLAQSVREHQSPQANDGWLLIPADHPIVESSVLDRLIATWHDAPDSIIVPTHAGRRGHPTILPWALAGDLDRIPAGHGVNWLVRNSRRVIEVDVREASIFWDVDTPADFAFLKQKLERNLS